MKCKSSLQCFWIKYFVHVRSLKKWWLFFSRLCQYDLVYTHKHTIKHCCASIFWPIFMQIKTVSAEDQWLSLTDIRHSGGLTGEYEMNTDSGLVAKLSLYPILLTFKAPLEQSSLLQQYLLETMRWDLSSSHYCTLTLPLMPFIVGLFCLISSQKKGTEVNPSIHSRLDNTDHILLCQYFSSWHDILMNDDT